MAAKLSTSFLWPLSRFSRISSRSKALPSPSVIRPSRSIMVTPPISRLDALSGIQALSYNFCHALTYVALHCRGAILRSIPLRHDDFGTAALPHQNVKLIHECLHQQNAASGLTQHIFVHSRIG